MANIEVHSQEGARKLKKYLAQYPLAKDLAITEVASACTEVLTGKDLSFLRVWVTPDDPVDEILEILDHFTGVNQFDIEVAPLLRFIPRKPSYDGHLP